MYTYILNEKSRISQLSDILEYYLYLKEHIGTIITI